MGRGDDGGAREAPERPRFVDHDVRAVRGDDRLPGLEHRGQTHHVRPRATPARQGHDGGVEALSQEVLGAAGPGVVAVGQGRAVVGLSQGVDHLGRHTGGVVAGEGPLRR